MTVTKEQALEELAKLTSPKPEELIEKITDLPNDDSELTEPTLTQYNEAIKPAEGPPADAGTPPPADAGTPPPAGTGDYNVEEVTTISEKRGADKVFKVDQVSGNAQYLVFKKADKTTGNIVMTGGQKNSKSQKRGGKKQRQTKRKMGGRRRSNRRR
jgi:hypothetical protein